MQDPIDPITDGPLGSGIEDPQAPHVTSPQKRRPRTDDVLAKLALEAALPPEVRERLRSGAVTAILVQVPAPEWCEPVWDALQALALVQHVVMRDENGRSRPESATSVFTRGELAAGRRVAGISSDLDRLPTVVVRAADAVITIPPPTPALLRRVIGEVTCQRPPRRVPSSLGAGLAFNDIVAAIRAGSTPAACVQRLMRAATTAPALTQADETPPLEELHGYGKAREWGLSLARSIAQVRAGRADPRTLPRGILLEGETGTGKTMFVRALAKTCKIQLIATTVGEWFTTFRQGHLDEVARACQESYQAACEAAGSNSLAIWFIDEIDGLPDRRGLEGRGRDFWSPIVGRVLSLLDGAMARGSILVVAATNHADRLDPALIRAGRFDVRMTIRRPDQDAICGILRTHLGADLRGADLRPLALAALGATGADVAQWVREARRRANIAERPLHIRDLADQIIAPDSRSPWDVLRSAIHEAGHAVATTVLRTGDLIRLVSILSGDGTGGQTVCVTPPGILPDRALCEVQIMTLLAGRASEIVMLGNACIGSGGGPDSDLARATALATQMHTSFGFGSSLLYRGNPNETLHLLELDPALRQEVERLLVDLHERTLSLMRRHHAAIKALARALMKHRVLNGEEVARIIAPLLPAADPAAPARSPRPRRRRHRTPTSAKAGTGRRRRDAAAPFPSVTIDGAARPQTSAERGAEKEDLP
jgi:hypothetical protein